MKASDFLIHAPGLGAASAAVISLQFTRKLGDNGFMILMGSIGTVNFILSLATVYVLDKARNGSIIALQKLIEIDTASLLIFLAATLIAGSISVFLVLKIGKIFSRWITRLPYGKLVVSIIIFITILVIILSGWLGFIVLLISTAIGLIPATTKAARAHAMGCILMPVMVYFLL